MVSSLVDFSSSLASNQMALMSGFFFLTTEGESLGPDIVEN